jgi:hypothetical protein
LLDAKPEPGCRRLAGVLSEEWTKVFQIGFNKCGTRSFCHLFESSSYKALHWANGKIARDIKRSFEAGVAPLQEWPDVAMFCDMEQINRVNGPLIEGYRYFEYLHKSFPDAKFILNTRDVEDWLFSRVDHNKGTYLDHYRRHFKLKRTRDVMNRWREDWVAQHAAVRAYFADHPGALVEYDITNDKVEKLHAFFAPDFDLTKGEWSHVGKTRS